VGCQDKNTLYLGVKLEGRINGKATRNVLAMPGQKAHGQGKKLTFTTGRTLPCKPKRAALTVKGELLDVLQRARGGKNKAYAPLKRTTF